MGGSGRAGGTEQAPDRRCPAPAMCQRGVPSGTAGATACAGGSTRCHSGRRGWRPDTTRRCRHGAGRSGCAPRRGGGRRGAGRCAHHAGRHADPIGRRADRCGAQPHDRRGLAASRRRRSRGHFANDCVRRCGSRWPEAAGPAERHRSIRGTAPAVAGDLAARHGDRPHAPALWQLRGRRRAAWQRAPRQTNGFACKPPDEEAIPHGAQESRCGARGAHPCRRPQVVAR